VSTREQVFSDVRQSERQLRSAQASLDIQRRSVELNVKRLDLANDLFSQGTIQVLDVVDAQSALLNAQTALNNAQANLQSQVLQYLRDTGTLRLDPAAGQIARAMDRAAVQVKYGEMFDRMDQDAQMLEKP
jgi:outer membrane protein TolC